MDKLDLDTVVSNVSAVESYPPGTLLVKSNGENYRYGKAATRLRAGRHVYIGLNGGDKINDWWTKGDIITEGVNRKLYSSLSSRAKIGWVLLGLAATDVPKGKYCWVMIEY